MRLFHGLCSANMSLVALLVILGMIPTCSTRLVLCKFWLSLTSSMFWTLTSYQTTLPDCRMKMDHLQGTFGVKLILGFLISQFHVSRYCTIWIKSMWEKLLKNSVSCLNVDGGFGCTPGGESHAGQIFCCVDALAIVGSLHHIDKDLLGWWLCERQVKSGGLNGRPEKLPDVCYSWWVLSSLIIIDRVHWIDKDKLARFILDCQDKENGGISDRPDDAVDVYHTYFGVAGLSLLEYRGIKAIDPAYALPVDVVNRIFFNKDSSA